MKKMLYMVFLILLASGCKTTYDVHVETVQPWEGHFMTVKDFNEATKDIQLEEGRSIWVLSDRTLYRVISNLNGK